MTDAHTPAKVTSETWAKRLNRLTDNMHGAPHNKLSRLQCAHKLLEGNDFVLVNELLARNRSGVEVHLIRTQGGSFLRFDPVAVTDAPRIKHFTRQLSLDQDGTHYRGQIDNLNFKAQVLKEPCPRGINKGQVVRLTIFTTDRDNHNTILADYNQGRWPLRFALADEKVNWNAIHSAIAFVIEWASRVEREDPLRP